MKHYYLVRLYFTDCHFIMPYIFTSMKEACAYGEYEYRTKPDLRCYEVEEAMKIYPFYKL